MSPLTKNTVVKGLAVFAILTAMLIAAIGLPEKASAAYAADFQSGDIMGDSVFFDGGSMTQSQIQQFLVSQVPSCDTYGTQTSEYGGGTRAQYGTSVGYAPPYICLENYYENPTSLANNLGGTIPAGAWSAAQIISYAATTYSVSPKAILALIESQSGLVTDSWPFPNEYTTATGYGCPDTAPCQSEYYGFYNQVMNAARQFQTYGNNPSSYRYVAGKNNTILYNPNSSCGSSSVFIQNQATVGLYIYTPYQPDAAALNNLYGDGDSCSAYGNRNFWRDYTDWFGSTMGSDLVRSADNATVYLLSGAYKYPIADGDLLNDYSALGGVMYVSDTYLSAHTTSANLGNVVGGPDGTIYFVDANIKLPFTSCSMVAAYGYNCNSIIYLTSAQLGELASGPNMTDLYGTTSGKQFYVSNGIKQEVFDQQSLVNAGLSGAENVLLEDGLENLPYGSPIIRNNVVVNDRTTGASYLYDGTNYWSLNGDLTQNTDIGQLPSASLDDQSIPSAQKQTNFNGFVQDASNGNQYMLLANGLAQVTNASVWPTGVYTQLPDQLVSALPKSTSPINNQLIKTPSNGTVYYVTGGVKRPISAWGDLLTLQVNPLVINTIPSTEANQIPTGPNFYGYGTLVKSASSGTVYIVRDNSTLMPISSFVYAQDLGIPLTVRTMSSSDFNTYTITSPVETELTNNGSYYIGTMGQLYSLTQTQMQQYGFNANNFANAGNLYMVLPTSSNPLGNFIRGSDGTIYIVQNGQKQAFTSYAAYLAHGGTASNTVQVSSYFLSLISSGANISQ